MAKKPKVCDIETSDFSPSWIDPRFPNDDEYEAVKPVVRFYLIHSPCFHSSSRGISVDRWGKPAILLIDKLKDSISLKKGENYDYGKSKAEMKRLFDKYAVPMDFTSIKKNLVLFLNDGSVFESVFKHIRNAIAHSRWQVIDNWYYFEDGTNDVIEGVDRFCVTARIVLNYESLILWSTILVNGPSHEEADIINAEQKLDEIIEKLRMQFSGKIFARKDAIAALSIDGPTWKKVYVRGKRQGIMSQKNGKWSVITRGRTDEK